ncbi:MAG: hypothetical protein QGG42_17300 [Phycisphaerae bacterium]|nr:hypothetical protein [Phycisphaerae bacterium]
MERDREGKRAIVLLLLCIAALAGISFAGSMTAMRDVGLYKGDDAVFGVSPANLQLAAAGGVWTFVISVVAFVAAYYCGKRRSFKRASLVSGGVVVVATLAQNALWLAMSA